MVDRPLLGRNLTVKGDRWAYRIVIPEQPDSFTFTRAAIADQPADEREYEAHLAYVGRSDQSFVEVRIVRIVVNETRDKPAGSAEAELDRWTQEIYFDLRDRALTAARDFTDLVRLRGQPRIEPT